MTTPFVIDRDSISKNPRVSFVYDLVPVNTMIDDIERFINICFVDQGIQVVQHGRVIALRGTDENRLSSAFKAAVYLGKWDDMGNTDRFLKNMVAAGHSYEPIRGEHVMFLYIGVARAVYDHIITYSVGRSTRIAAGQRANLPWGYEVPLEAKDANWFADRGLERVREVIDIVLGENEETGKQQIQAARSMLPVGFIMPPFLYEFSEEALVHIFQQRLWEPGAQGATKEIVLDMLRCVQQLDPQKWETLEDYHGPHIMQWKKAMRLLRDKPVSMGDVLTKLEEKGVIPVTDEHELKNIDMYQAIMTLFGNMPVSMWDKQK